MVATRTAPTRPDAALENVLAILGASSATAPVRLALQLDGMNTGADILGLRQPELDALTYTTRTDEHAEMMYLSAVIVIDFAPYKDTGLSPFPNR